MLNTLAVRNVRGVVSADIALSEQVTLIVGQMGAGKSSLAAGMWRRLDAMVSYWKEKRDCPHIGDSHFQLREGNRQAFQEERDRHPRPAHAAAGSEEGGAYNAQHRDAVTSALSSPRS